MRNRRDRVVQAIGWTCQSGGTIGDMADAAIAAYEEDTVFECSECGGMGTVVGKYDDAALSALDAEPTNADIVEIQEDIFRTESRYIDKSSIRSVLRSAHIAARKAGRG